MSTQKSVYISFLRTDNSTRGIWRLWRCCSEYTTAVFYKR